MKMYLRLVDPSGGIWQSVEEAESAAKAREKVAQAIGKTLQEIGPRLTIKPLKPKRGYEYRSCLTAYTDISEEKFLASLLQPL